MYKLIQPEPFVAKLVWRLLPVSAVSGCLTPVAHRATLSVMIKSWQHKGLKRFFESGKKSGIIPDHARRLKVLLQLLHAANTPTCMDAPGFDFHTLKGDKAGFYSVAVRANWKLIFQFDGEDAILVDYLDYH